MAEEPNNTFLDVPRLLDSSVPRGQGLWVWYAAGALLLTTLAANYLSSQMGEGGRFVQGLASLAMLVMMGVLGAGMFLAARSARQEQLQLEAIEELLQLRRWSEAAEMIDGLLSRPTRTPAARAQGLIYLGSLLARYHRFADALAVYDHLLEMGSFDPGTTHGLKLGRAMAMLREDRLFDVDRAISDLRRDGVADESAGLALVEIYRDVKTGHPEEALDLFNKRKDLIRRQLGHRAGDVYALAARAADLLDNPSLAQSLYEDATHLAPELELHRRYPEVAELAGKYTAARPPMEGL